MAVDRVVMGAVRNGACVRFQLRQARFDEPNGYFSSDVQKAHFVALSGTLDKQ
jgi:hypothetical protein